jgi:hypothetical protein
MKQVALHLFVFSLVALAHQAVANHAELNVQSQSLRYNIAVNQTTYTHQQGTTTLDLLPGSYRVQIWNDVPMATRRPITNRHTPVFLYDAWVTLNPYETFTVTVERGGYVRTHSIVNCPAPVVISPAPICNKPYQGYYDGYNPAPVYYGMAPDAFQSLKHAVINRSFDSTKRELLADALRHNQFTSEQLYQLLNLLDFESSKVEIAKLGYSSVIDKQNFYRVYDAFTFDSSISELQRYIG